MFDWLPEQIAAVEATPAAQEQGWRFLLNPPASEEAIARCEAALGLPLPPSYRAFLSRWDGASLFRREHTWPDGQVMVTAGLEVAGTRLLPDLNARLRAEVPAWPEDWEQLIAGGEAPVGEGDLWLLHAGVLADGEYAVLAGWHDEAVYCWRRAVIAPSFEAWLERVFATALRGDDPCYWLAGPELLARYQACHAEGRRPAPPMPVPPGGFPRASAGGTRREARRRDEAGR